MHEVFVYKGKKAGADMTGEEFAEAAMKKELF